MLNFIVGFFTVTIASTTTFFLTTDVDAAAPRIDAFQNTTAQEGPADGARRPRRGMTAQIAQRQLQTPPPQVAGIKNDSLRVSILVETETD